MFCDNRLVRLEGIGPTLWHLAGRALGPDDLVEAVLAEVGPAPEGVDPEGRGHRRDRRADPHSA
ncbi:hypothetical protein Q0F99_13675 [Rathayibacter oskolensis]|uniref:hypothetical protein n=1 Tax=Rathayibacter oskolensis TaxID=1891671 RepID=UPI00265FD6B4|nr:hypothetical protein [Rathayibacter oskolensis]WKK70807.1 hypothetical protein Q0F99_13675 [Rathayibacter oskolensis]